MAEFVFKKTDIDEKKRMVIEDLTAAEPINLRKPIKLSDEIKELLGNDYALLIVNRDSKAARIVPVTAERVIKLVVYIKDPGPFIRRIIDVYKKYNIKIIFTTGICLRGEKMEDCIYEAYLDMSKSGGLDEIKIIEKLEGVGGIEKIFTIPIKVK